MARQTSFSRPRFMTQLLLLVVVLLSHPATVVHAEFNYEVEKRVLERINDYMNGPRIANGITEKYRANGGFLNDLSANDRNAYLALSYSLMQEFKFDMLYFGLEDGTFIGHGVGWGTYREPGNSGYPVTGNSNVATGQQVQRDLYFDTCVDRATGQDQNCTLAVGDNYVQCVRNCGLMKCADEETQACAGVGLLGPLQMELDSTLSHCAQPTAQKWCRQYEVREVQAEQEQKLGYVPRTYHCHDERGQFTEQPGQALVDGFLEPYGSPKIQKGDCEYDNGVKVDRYEVGSYVYCQKGGDNNDNQVCTDAFDGGFRSRAYDPRYRGWYTKTKKIQLPNWSEPYPFFTSLDLGITYSMPIYSMEEESERYVFDGVLAIDYTFADIGNFLLEGYQDSSTLVVVYEKSDPNYLVAASTGRKSAAVVLAEDETTPCPDATESSKYDCIVVRESMNSLKGYPMDDLLVKAYQAQRDQNYPRELLTVKVNQKDRDTAHDDDIENDDDDEMNAAEGELYIVQSSFYQPGEALEWIILVISPAGTGSTDAVTKESSLFGLVCVVASLGFILCFIMFYLFFRQRHKRAVILADWRFTSAFLLGCAFLNVSSFTLLGENTDALCVLRMWSFHFLFAVALSPMFVKVWRMWRMVGSPSRRPAIIDNKTSILLSLPIIIIQCIILFIATLVDPPRQEEIIEIEEGIVTQHIVCDQDSIAFTATFAAYEFGLVLIGCVLAYVTRNLDTQFGESKQLMFSMYNIAFIGIITTVIIFTMDIDANGQIVLKTIGVFWGTVFSSAAFVLPRLLAVKDEMKNSNSILRNRKGRSTAKAASGVGNNRASDVARSSRVRFSGIDDDNSEVVASRRSGVSDDEEKIPSMPKTDGVWKPIHSEGAESKDTEKKSNRKGDKSKKKKKKKDKKEERKKKKKRASKRKSSEFGSGNFRGTGWTEIETSDGNFSTRSGKKKDSRKRNEVYAVSPTPISQGSGDGGVTGWSTYEPPSEEEIVVNLEPVERDNTNKNNLYTKSDDDDSQDSDSDDDSSSYSDDSDGESETAETETDNTNERRDSSFVFHQANEGHEEAIHEGLDESATNRTLDGSRNEQEIVLIPSPSGALLPPLQAEKIASEIEDVALEMAPPLYP